MPQALLSSSAIRSWKEFGVTSQSSIQWNNVSQRDLTPNTSWAIAKSV
jgi:hypothetical protein